MQLATFEARCDVELGDEVRFANSVITKITDIRAVHYLKEPRVEFEFELELFPGNWCGRNDFIYPVPKRGEIKQYIDDRGWTYFVRAGIGGNTFKTFYKKDSSKPAGMSEHAYRGTPWRKTEEQARADLDALAQKKSWRMKGG